jgi:hypothetical protein
MIEYRHSERCVEHRPCEEEPGYTRHTLRVTFRDAATGRRTRTATQFVVSHNVTGLYAHCT